MTDHSLSSYMEESVEEFEEDAPEGLKNIRITGNKVKYDIPCRYLEALEGSSSSSYSDSSSYSESSSDHVFNEN